MNALNENTLISITPETIQTFHDLTMIWLQSNFDATGISPEDLYCQYRRIYDRIADADAAEQKSPGCRR
jgi:hypothetical protein